MALSKEQKILIVKAEAQIASTLEFMLTTPISSQGLERLTNALLNLQKYRNGE